MYPVPTQYGGYNYGENRRISLDPVNLVVDDREVVTSDESDDDDKTVIMSNTTTYRTQMQQIIPQQVTIATTTTTQKIPVQRKPKIGIDKSHAIADTGATAIFVMESAPVNNKRVAQQPLTISLPDGTKVKSTHECDITIPGLPTVLTGHIVPSLTVASLIGIRVLCEAGCTVTFNASHCDVIYNGKVIARGNKDPSTDLWTLPIYGTTVIEERAEETEAENVMAFTHSITQRVNQVKFAHQALGSPKISKLLKAVRRGYLKGCPNISETLITKYLNPSPATAKGHMKRPRYGIKSTTPKQPPTIVVVPPIVIPPIVMPPQVVPPLNVLPPPMHNTTSPNVIEDDCDASIANVFCFGAFADKNTGVMYHDMTGNFPFMSLDGCICYLIMYHYESNSILATPIDSMDDMTIFEAYKKNFEMLEKKGFSVKLNVMDNQATKNIMKFLDEKDCKVQLVEPHNKRLNAAERAIQTWKDALISVLATTDSDFPLQLWDRLTPQVQDTVNLMRASRIDPTMSAYEALNGPYDWNRYPMAPLGCKAIIYEDGDTRGSWGARGVDGWYLGPSKNHYRCDHYFIPETRAYRISGSTELYPQHCQKPSLTPMQHLRALAKEIEEETAKVASTTHGRELIKALRTNISKMLNRPKEGDEQRVMMEQQQVERDRQQRVIDDTPIITIPRITDAQPIMKSRNPTSKRTLKGTKRLHRRVTRNNTPGAVPPITRVGDDNPHGFPPYDRNKAPVVTPTPQKYVAIPRGARSRIVTRQAINVLTIMEQVSASSVYTPRALMAIQPPACPADMKHYMNPAVHPVTGETFTSYKKAMKDPAIADIWQTAFGKEFGGMAQGDSKTGTAGTNAMFVMTHDDIARLRGKKYTYANIVLDHRPQKEDPNRIRITAGGDRIQYDDELSVRSADITTAKLHWNSVISTENARYMCLDLSLFYLSAALEYYEYMKIPLALFPAWIVEQYNLLKHAKDGMVHIEMRRAVWGLPQAGILANKKLRRKLAPHGYHEHANTPGLWYHESRPISFTLVVDDFGVKYVGREHVDHLIKCLKQTYKLTEDWTGSLYCGITLDWNYEEKYVDISMPGYVKKKLQEYNHIVPLRHQTCPYSPEPRTYGTKAQAPIPVDESPKLDAKGIKRVQKIVGSILYYARAVDMTVLMALSSIAVEQTTATEQTMKKCHQLLDYLASNSEAKVRFYASAMVLNIHSDASYLSESNARSRTCGHYFMGWDPKDNEPIRINGAFFVNTTIMRFVVASAAEAELGALFRNCQDGVIFRLTLENLGHPQPRTPVHCDNATAVGIANNTVKRQRARAMEMRFFWIADKVAQDMYTIFWHPGQEILADYQSKHHIGSHHVHVRPYYLHMENSPRTLPRAMRPSTLKGCVGTLKDGYIRNVPLPRLSPRTE